MPGFCDTTSLAIISKELFKDKDQELINIGFPGEEMWSYDLEKEKAAKNDKMLTKFDFLKELINKNSLKRTSNRNKANAILW
ncbi:MAG: hypothetical protein NTW10_02465 [Bacteroidetes bacterium]|nr:hypothetical protein [Bacteroidota bacterium]